MDRYQWPSEESDFAFKQVDGLIQLLHDNFAGDSSVNIGFVYISVGLILNGGKN